MPVDELGTGRGPVATYGMRGPITLGEHRGLQLVARPFNWLIGNVSAETSGSWRAMASSSRSQRAMWRISALTLFDLPCVESGA